MTQCGASHPASQGEHLISHFIDMFAPAGRAEYFHGEQVAVATLTMAAIQDDVLDAGPPRLSAPSIGLPDLKRLFGTEIGTSCWREFEAKLALQRASPDFAQRISAGWNDVRERLRRVTVPRSRIAAALERAGCPTTPAQIGLLPDFYDRAVRHARFLRDRYTFLDLADAAGRLSARASSAVSR
jgi:glycerol-1-phosphate dehydrogenase [NAD(P)+]